MIEEDATVRQAAKKFSISKSTVHKDVTQRLRMVHPNLYEQVKKVLDKNKQERHIRGGLATREKYEALRHGEDAATLEKKPQETPTFSH